MKASLTVGENAAFWSGFLGGARDRVEPALATFGLQPLRDIPAGYLSAGQRRRLGLARLLLAERPVWLLDEPTASLDDGAQRTLTAVVNRHLGAGGLVVAATHMPLELASARELRLGGVAQLHDGILAAGAPRSAASRGRKAARSALTLGFYLVVVTMLPLGLGPDLNLLSRIAPGVLWVALLLAALLSLGPHVRDRLRGRLARGARHRARCRWRLSRRPRASRTG